MMFLSSSANRIWQRGLAGGHISPEAMYHFRYRGTDDFVVASSDYPFSEEEVREVEEHVAACGMCAARLQGLMRIPPYPDR